jgi:ParB-like chromosome segregation protein Spo0J
MNIRIVKKNLSDLIPADYNPRKTLQPGDAQFDSLRNSIESFGYVEPIVWNASTSNVVGGHQRLNVLLEMGETETDVIVVELDPQREKALNVALNKVTGLWDEAKLDDLLQELSEAGLLENTGFSQEEFDQLVSRMDIDGFFSGEYNPPDKKEKIPKTIKCPHCGKVFEL